MGKFNHPEEPFWPFEGAHPPHGNGGHAARSWSKYSSLTIFEATALSFGMNPITCGSFWADRKNYGTLQIGMWNDRIQELIRAVYAGEIRAIYRHDETELTEDTLVYTTDVEKYLFHTQQPITEDLSQPVNHVSLLLEQSSYFQELRDAFEEAIKEFPTWREKQNTVQKTGNLTSWLVEEQKFNTKEAEIIKKIIREIYKF